MQAKASDTKRRLRRVSNCSSLFRRAHPQLIWSDARRRPCRKHLSDEGAPTICAFVVASLLEARCTNADPFAVHGASLRASAAFSPCSNPASDTAPAAARTRHRPQTAAASPIRARTRNDRTSTAGPEEQEVAITEPLLGAAPELERRSRPRSCSGLHRVAWPPQCGCTSGLMIADGHGDSLTLAYL